MAKNPKAVLKDCREKISDIDRKIFLLIKEREKLSVQIGSAKRELALPDRDFNREKAVFLQAIALAKEYDLPEGFAINLQKIIIEASLSKQEQDRIKQNHSKKEKSVAIIGGAGRLGKWLGHFFLDSGFHISVIDPVDPGFPCTHQMDFDASIGKHDSIVVATPIRVSVAVLQKLLSFAPMDSVIFDVSSVKAPVHQALCELRDRGAQVTSLHPMFGPSVGLLYGKHVIRTSLGVKEADALVDDIFSSTSLNIVDMGIDEHDAVIAILLGLSHVINIIFVNALRKDKFTIDFLLQFSSPTFSHLVGIAKKVMAENPRLYFEIQALNPHTKKVHEKLLASVTKVLDIIKAFDEEKFVALMNEGHRFLSPTP